MLSSADAMGKIQQIYMEGSRPVPYLTFMNVFNDLLEDPVKVIPKKPDEELKERLRAACMAVNVGVYDTEGRGDDRIREFKEKVLPVWKEYLPPDEFAKFSDILEGGMRTKFRKDGQKLAAADTVTESGSFKTSELLRRLGIAPEEPQPAEGAEGEPEVDVTPKAAEPKEEPAFELEAPGGAVLEEPSSSVFPLATGAAQGVFASVDELVEALRDGSLPIKFRHREDMTPFARYGLGQEEVEVRLVDGNTRNYVISAVSAGYDRLPDGENAMDDIAGEMGYLKTDELTYRRHEGDFLLRIRAQADRIDMPCGYPKNGDAQSIIQQIQKLHRDLGELLERLEPQP